MAEKLLTSLKNSKKMATYQLTGKSPILRKKNNKNCFFLPELEKGRGEKLEWNYIYSMDLRRI